MKNCAKPLQNSCVTHQKLTVSQNYVGEEKQWAMLQHRTSKNKTKNLSCSNYSLFPVVDADKLRLSEATRGIVLHWYVRALHPSSPASDSQEGMSRSVCPDPSLTSTISVVARTWWMEELFGKQNFSFTLYHESHKFYMWGT